MKQYEAVIKVMEENGGYATLGYLYQNVLDVPGTVWKTRTPYASIRRIVQDDRFFFKIRPGLWALNSCHDVVLEKFAIGEESSEEQQQEFNHSYYQGLLIELGNLKSFQTFVPYQDKNKTYLSRPLSAYTTLEGFYEFTYPHIVRRAITIDVTWFNKRRLPDSFFEVEHTTDIQNSLLKFLELQDFNANFNIVASENRFQEFEKKLSYAAFDPIKNRVKFIDYDRLSVYHTKAFELQEIQKKLTFTF
ncbi:MAG: hypothetical protein JW981_04650 [Anaerolineae bacterium]|nr:hypothetical protein [Anaerolineae bacterium]